MPRKKVSSYLIINPKEKSTVFNDNVLEKKQFRGKTDRLALYKYLQKEWKKTPILKKKPKIIPPVVVTAIREESPIKEKQVIKFVMFQRKEQEKQRKMKDQKINNVTRPISYYRKFQYFLSFL